MQQKFVVKVAKPRTQALLRSGRWFVYDQLRKYTYRGSIPENVKREVGKADYAFYQIELVNNLPRFIERLPDQGW